MGEYAMYNGKRIKIGTGEVMHYLRADQAALVTAIKGYADPIQHAETLLFRFPFPDEDNLAPGAFEDDHPLDVKVTVPGADAPFAPLFEHRLLDGHLVLVCTDRVTRRIYELPTLADAEGVISACRAKADGAPGGWWAAVADRIAAGYTSPLNLGGPASRDAANGLRSRQLRGAAALPGVSDWHATILRLAADTYPSMPPEAQAGALELAREMNAQHRPATGGGPAPAPALTPADLVEYLNTEAERERRNALGAAQAMIRGLNALVEAASAGERPFTQAGGGTGLPVRAADIDRAVTAWLAAAQAAHVATRVGRTD